MTAAGVEAGGGALGCVGEGLWELGFDQGSDVPRTGYGGDVANVAVMAARLGCDARIGGRVGDDPLGRRLVAFWAGQGVDTSFLIADAEAPTGIYVNELQAAGGHAFHYHRRGSAGSRLALGDLGEEFLAGLGILHLSGITLAVSDSSAEAALDVATRAQALGARISLAVNHRPALGGDIDELARIARAADIVLLSLEEAEPIFDVDEPGAVAAVLPQAEVVVTAGADGAHVFAGGVAAHVAAPAIAAVDAAGAGDALAGAYLAGRLAGVEPAVALRRGVVAAALSCRRSGCAASYPSAAEVEAGLGGVGPEDVLAAIAAQRIVPVLRTRDLEDAVETARACGRAGLRVVELTRSTPGVADAVAALAEDDLLVGVGTVDDADQIAPLAEAGARFVVSFAHPPGFVAAAHAAGIAAIPAGFTPEELAAAMRAGAEAVKLFPGRLATPAYLRDLRPVLPGLRVLVTGGVDPEGVAPWLEAGAVAVGLGSALGTAATVGADEVERRCRAALAAL